MLLGIVPRFNYSLALRHALSNIAFSRVSFEHLFFFFLSFSFSFYPSSSVDVQDVHGL